MPNLENLIDMIAEELEKSQGEAWYSSVDMTYAYGQVPLHELTKRHSNFQIVGVGNLRELIDLPLAIMV